jgi:hypothetical protein
MLLALGKIAVACFVMPAGIAATPRRARPPRHCRAAKCDWWQLVIPDLIPVPQSDLDIRAPLVWTGFLFMNDLCPPSFLRCDGQVL